MPGGTSNVAPVGADSLIDKHSQPIGLRVQYIAAYHLLWRANALVRIPQRHPFLAPAARSRSQTRLPQSRMRIQSSRSKQICRNPHVQ
jgi:hypothetical protein